MTTTRLMNTPFQKWQLSYRAQGFLGRVAAAARRSSELAPGPCQTDGSGLDPLPGFAVDQDWVENLSGRGIDQIERWSVRELSTDYPKQPKRR